MFLPLHCSAVGMMTLGVSVGGGWVRVEPRQVEVVQRDVRSIMLTAQALLKHALHLTKDSLHHRQVCALSSTCAY